MSLMQFLAIVRAHRAVALLVLLATLAAALSWVALRPARYTARVPVLVDAQPADVGGGYAPALVASFMATQLDVARSERVAWRALDALDAGDAPPPRQATRPDALTPGERATRLARARALQQRLEVRPARESNLLQVAWTGDSPAEAARVANAFAWAVVDVSLSLRTDPAKQDSAWYGDQVRASRETLEAAQMRLAQFQRGAGIVGSEQADHELARLNHLSTQLALAQAQTTDAQSRLGASRDTVAEVMQSPLVNGLKTDIARLESRRQEAAATLGPRHPQMVRIEAELAAVQSRLAQETTRIGSAIETAFRAGKTRERELGAAVDAQREKVLALNQDRARLALLQQDVDAARRAYEAVTTGASKTQLQSLATQAHLSVLAPAQPPDRPAGPGLGQALAVGAVAGLLLGVAVALMLEFADRRVRSVDDIALAADLPVLATLSTAGAAPPALPPVVRRLGFT
jgi:chain length determinant protein EpsF